MKAINPDRCVLLLVDYQQRLMPLIHDGPRVLAEATFLADVADTLGIRVVGTEQNPQGLGPNVEGLRQRCAATMPKMHFDACADGLLELLRPNGAGAPLPDVVIGGCEAHVCLLQTAHGLLRAGVALWVVEPACGSRSSADHRLAMQRLRQSGATLVSAEMVAFEWLQSCRHERFRPVLQRIKSRFDNLQQV